MKIIDIVDKMEVLLLKEVKGDENVFGRVMPPEYLFHGKPYQCLDFFRGNTLNSDCVATLGFPVDTVLVAAEQPA